MGHKEVLNHEQVALFIDSIDKISVDEIGRVIKNYRANAYDNAYSNTYARAYTRAHKNTYADTTTRAYKNAYTCALAKANDTIDTNMYATAVSNTTLALLSRDTSTIEDFEILISPCRFLLEELGIVDSLEKGD
jgi:hypothetical protein